MELRTSRSSFDEYEDTESDYKGRTSARGASRLRTRKNVFNRPFATDSSIAPTIVERPNRRSLGSFHDADLIERRSSELNDTQIDYLDEDYEYEEETSVVKPRKTKTRAKTKKKNKKNVLAKCGWGLIGLLILRLIFMDRGVWDYFSTENSIKNKQNDLSSIIRENKELKTEITRIQVDKNFQRQLAKEHLGVIAADEFLILFAGDSGQLADELSSI